ncbi:hypothetical protein EXIGLDRAFT_414033 [Exidia glandulosa HHB12029]|uniref:beta-glucosidase n=1 Tax=Exidia glandulosa HHB12029 TaxID=1314781 RepID=A0A165PQL1_EXIGL|nr:hypothetical protein EXIGLDRAFT_414033 [Exidia glandulosa HHB12029]
MQVILPNTSCRYSDAASPALRHCGLRRSRCSGQILVPHAILVPGHPQDCKAYKEVLFNTTGHALVFERPHAAMTTLKRLSFLSLLQLCALATQDVQLAQRAATPDDCAGYNARNMHQTAHSLSADLVRILAGACALYGEDIPNLKLTVSYEDSSRLHVKIADAAGKRYQVPQSVFPRPESANLLAVQSELEFKYKTAPFSFQVIRRADKEVLFDTTGHALVFEQQYIRLQTSLPPSANIYGLGEHSNTFRLPNNNLTRTFWNRDAYGVAEGSNLYSTHPIYFEHRTTGTHGVFLLNSNGIDVKIKQVNGKTALEYNAIGGIFDFYFLSGSKKDPSEVSRQYAKVAGLPAEVPYWSFGFHQCRYGYQNFVEVADVVANYSKAGIPLETMWTDIDYMKDRWVFTNDPQYFPTNRVQEIIHYLHAHDQHYIRRPRQCVQYHTTFYYKMQDE